MTKSDSVEVQEPGLPNRKGLFARASLSQRLGQRLPNTSAESPHVGMTYRLTFKVVLDLLVPRRNAGSDQSHRPQQRDQQRGRLPG